MKTIVVAFWSTPPFLRLKRKKTIFSYGNVQIPVIESSLLLISQNALHFTHVVFMLHIWYCLCTYNKQFQCQTKGNFIFFLPPHKPSECRKIKKFYVNGIQTQCKHMHLSCPVTAWPLPSPPTTTGNPSWNAGERGAQLYIRKNRVCLPFGSVLAVQRLQIPRTHSFVCVCAVCVCV